MAFIFDPSKGETPASLRKKREIAEALRANATGLASSPGEGLAMIGAAIGSRMADSKANKIEAYGRQQASSALGPIMEALGGGGSSSPSPAPSAPSAPASPQSAPATSITGGKAEFVNALLPAAIEESKRTGIDPRIIVAQAAQETGWGRSAPGNNFFGIKSHGKGGGQNLTTHEVINGRRVKINDSFRTFNSPADSVRGYGDFMLQNPRYRSMRAAQGLDSQLEALGASGYATDPQYAASVGSIARGIQIPDGIGAASYSTPSASPVSPASQAVNAMAQGGQGMPQPAPQPAPATGGSAMDVWQGRAQQGTANDGSQLVRTPEGVQRTSGRYGYSEMIRPEGMPSERAPMPRQGQGGGIGAILSSLLGRGGQQQAPQAMPQQAAPQQPVVADPAAYNAGVVRMSPDLAGGPQRMPTPQNQPPIPGIQPSPLTMADMAGRMPAPQGQPMPAPQAPVAPQPAQAAPQPAQAGANGISLPKLLQIAQDPWVAENKLYSGIVTTLIENQLSMNKPMNPLEKAQLEKLMLDIEQQRNPVAKPTGTMTEYDLYAEQEQAAGRQPMGIFEYQQALGKSGASNITVGGDSSDRRKKFEEATGTSWQKIVDQGTKSSSMMQDMQFLDELIEMAPQGPIQGRLAEMFPGFSSAGAAFNAIVKRVAPTMRAEGSGSTSDIEYDGMLKSLAALQNYPEANRLIAGMMKAKAQVDMDMAAIVNAWSVGDLTDQGATKKMQELQSKSIMSPELKRLMVGLQPNEAGGVDDLVDKWSK